MKISHRPWYERIVYGFGGFILCQLLMIIAVIFLIFASVALPFMALFYPEWIDEAVDKKEAA